MKTMMMLLVGLGLSVGVVQADDDMARHVRVLGNVVKAYQAQAEAVLAQQQTQIDKKCPLKNVEGDNLSVLVVPTYADDGMPNHGSWAVTYRARACNKPVQRMVHFKGTKTGLTVEAGPPGTTMADPVLGADVWRKFKVATLRQFPDCNPQDMKLLNTQLVEEPSTAGGGMWREAWLGLACGRQVGQVVVFHPTRAGTVFRLALPDEPKRTVAPSYGVGR